MSNVFEAQLNLLEDFPPVSREEWEAAIARDLKGADYRKRLLWQTEEGIGVLPVWGKEDLPATAGSAWFRKPEPGWRVGEAIHAVDTRSSLEAAREAVAGGVESLMLILHGPVEVARLLAEFDPERLELHLRGAARIEGMTEHLSAAPEARRWSGSSDFHLESLPRFFLATGAGQLCAESGATSVEELGLALAAASDLLAGGIRDRIAVDLSAGPNYFFEMAKFRAARLLYARIAEVYGAPADPVLTARTTLWNQTLEDPRNNLLRGATAAMAAIAGGCDALFVRPFDEAGGGADPSGRRLARNMQWILRAESRLDAVTDPAAGSYYVEALTASLAQQAWTLFQAIEAQGGFARAAASGSIRSLLRASRAAKADAAAHRRKILVGANQYVNTCEAVPDAGTPEWRLAAPFEQLRRRSARFAGQRGRAAQAALLEMGDARMRQARAAFCESFFACGGFQTYRAQSIAAAISLRPDLIVLCSSDEEYAQLVPGVAASLREATLGVPLLIAGYPKDSVESLRAAGVADFIHLRSNTLETLAALRRKVGMEE